MSSSPISRVDYDSILTIFEMLASQMPDGTSDADRPLNVVRAASQVCRRWRQLLMQSSRIWGRVVDLGVVRYGTTRIKWMEEVVRRAGSAPLWISGEFTVRPTVDPLRFDSLGFFLRLFESLERIERVSIVIRGDTIPRTITSRFLLRAPILKTFHVKFLGCRKPVLSETLRPESSERLFLDYAPSLEDIHTTNLAIRMDSPCLSRIRKITLSSSTMEHYSLEDVLILLQRAPYLESFTLFGGYPSSVGPSLHSPDLSPYPNAGPPTLTYIQMAASLGFTSKILEFVKPGKLSAFRIMMVDARPKLIDRDALPSLSTNLPSFIASYFTANAAKKLLLKLGPYKFNLRDVTAPFPTSPSNPSSGGATFSICVDHELRIDVDRDALMTCLMGAFLEASALSHNLCPYKSVNELTITFEARFRCTTFSSLYSMLALFENIQLLITDDCSCQVISALAHHLQGDPPANQPPHVLFPKLHTIRLTVHQGSASINFAHVIRFLTNRNQVGFPVAKFDMTTWSRRNEVHDLSALEHVGGLEVLWRQSETGVESDSEEDDKICSYICGSGNPQRLHVVL